MEETKKTPNVLEYFGIKQKEIYKYEVGDTFAYPGDRDQGTLYVITGCIAHRYEVTTNHGESLFYSECYIDSHLELCHFIQGDAHTPTDEEYEVLNTPFEAVILAQMVKDTLAASSSNHQGSPQKDPRPTQAYYGQLKTDWKFGIMDLIEHQVLGELKIINTSDSPNQYECLGMADGRRWVMAKTRLEAESVKKTELNINDYCKPNVDVMMFNTDVTFERKCRHTTTKINHAGGINFKQCCHCKEDLGNV